MGQEMFFLQQFFAIPWTAVALLVCLFVVLILRPERIQPGSGPVWVGLMFALASSAFGGVISDVPASGDVSNQGLAPTVLLGWWPYSWADVLIVSPDTFALIVVINFFFGLGILGLFILLLAGFRTGSKTALNHWGIISALLLGLQWLLLFGVTKLAAKSNETIDNSKGDAALLWGIALIFSASLVAYFLLGNRRLKRTRKPDAP